MQLHTVLKQQAQELFEPLLAIRRHLHQHPELSYQEHNTASFVETQLTAWGIAHQRMAGTGVVALITGTQKTNPKTVALRGDMDALPIQENTGLPFASQVPGVMHACGHDVHTTCLLGAAKLLQQNLSHFSGTVKLIFQPGEERNPGGASILIKEGVLQNPAPEAIIALHVHPGLETGKLSFRSGRVMASADEIYITIKSKGGHAAAPHLTADTVLIAAHLITSLQQIVSRNNNPTSPSVLSICSIQGGHTTNVIPSEVKLMGTFRAMDEEWRYKAHELMKKQAVGLVEAMGAEIDFLIDVGYPTVDNEPQLTQQCTQAAQDMWGAENVLETEMRMGAEDFGYYTKHIPGCFFRLGVRNEQINAVHNVHTPTFIADEHAIPIGVATMAHLAIRYLEK
ncbi:MAG: amidohydrolase [Bacteroidetes bacterium]|nr:MAG: amidohydrolase [Bacteroidota bacterium]